MDDKKQSGKQPFLLPLLVLKWKKTILLAIPVVLFLLALPFALHYFSQGVGAQTGAESLEMMEKAVTRAAIECYALEGFYPPTLEYLGENYGIATDHKQFFIDYTYLGSNLMPIIAVIPISEEVGGFE